MTTETIDLSAELIAARANAVWLTNEIELCHQRRAQLRRQLEDAKRKEAAATYLISTMADAPQ